MNTAESFAELPVTPKPPLRRFHQARWDEPIIFELSTPGRRGLAVPEPGAPPVELPESVRRAEPPGLPELSQQLVLRHYLRLSQENLGADLNIDVGQGTCTMKYSPKVNDSFAAAVAELHPLQHEDTVQGVLEIYWRLEQMLAEISGMARVSLQPGSGSAAIYANIAMIRAYHAANGEGPGSGARDQVITTMFSHPSNAACAKTAGYEVITLMPDADGLPDIEALRAAVGPRTAALMITNPEDTGIFNPRIQEFVDLVHQAGAWPATTRPTPTASSASPVPATPGSTCATSTCTRRSPPRTPAAARRPARAASRPSWPRSCRARSSPPTARRTGWRRRRARSARSGRSSASPPTSCGRTPGSWPWAPTGCARWPRRPR